MVRNLLSMTRLEAGALELDRDWVDLGEALERAVDLAKRRGAPQRFTIPPRERPLPLLRADTGLLDQALGNVVANTVRHAGAGAHVTLSAGCDEDGFTVEIADDGPGVPETLRAHVFEKFTRARRSAADGGESAGLGLAIAKGILEAHGGTIELVLPDAAHPRGAVFRLRLPNERGNDR
jgi:two-component system sensor histidine kinase KdpD